jgi:hypothetical protein
MPGRQAFDAAIDGVRFDRRPGGEGFGQPARIDRRALRQGRQKGLHLGREPQPAGFAGEVQRTDAGAVARQHEAASGRIPQRDRELAVEVLHEIVAVAVVQVHDHFGVGLRVEDPSLGFQLAA